MIARLVHILRILVRHVIHLPRPGFRVQLPVFWHHYRLFGFRETLDEIWRQLNTPRSASPMEVKPGMEPARRSRSAEASFDITVIIPTRNGGSDLEALLRSLQQQRGINRLELILIDSSSSDSTCEIGTRYGARIIPIDPADFSHSFARNLGVRHATCPWCLFTVQDALPDSPDWLYRLVSALEANQASAVSCIEQPHDETDLLSRVISWHHYRQFRLDQFDRILVQPALDRYLPLRENAHLSNIACLIRRSVIEQTPFRGDFAEDLALGLDLLRQGHRLLFLQSTSVIHGHNRPAGYYLRRSFIDYITMSTLFDDYIKPADTLATVAPNLLHGLAAVIRFAEVLGDGGNGFAHPSLSRGLVRLQRNLFMNPGSFDPIPDIPDPDIDKLIRLLVSRPEGNGIPRVNNPFSMGLQGYNKLVLMYLDQHNSTPDAVCIREFRDTLLKVFALHAGMVLGSCYRHDRSMDADTRKALYQTCYHSV
jgi:glycosyltransferase involved in cell wall biosynthesis